MIGGFTVVLARSGVRIEIPPGGSILHALREADIPVLFNCDTGKCGVCECRVLEGVPDHRDQVLTAAEKADNGLIMLCCSGSHTGELVLDL